MKLTLKFEFEKETPGAVRYKEIGGEAVGTLYVRKAVMPDPHPKRLEVTVCSPE
jgi:hypothetical protein